MKHDYAKIKLECLLRDLSSYTAAEFRRQMMRIASGATGEDIPDDAHTIKSERDALAAQVEALQGLIKEAAHDGYWDASDSNRADRWHDNFDESVRSQFEKYWVGAASHYNITPQQALAEIRADAGRAGFDAGYSKCWREVYGTKPNADSLEEYADAYAERIRQGGEK